MNINKKYLFYFSLLLLIFFLIRFPNIKDAEKIVIVDKQIIKKASPSPKVPLAKKMPPKKKTILKENPITNDQEDKKYVFLNSIKEPMPNNKFRLLHKYLVITKIEDKDFSHIAFINPVNKQTIYTMNGTKVELREKNLESELFPHRSE